MEGRFSGRDFREAELGASAMSEPSKPLKPSKLWEKGKPPTMAGVADLDRLRAAWARALNKGAAGGADGMAAADFERDAEENLSALAREMREGTFVPEPLARFEVDKPGKPEKRTLGLPAVRNKIVHWVVAEGLAAFYEPRFSDCSYAYRPNKGTVKAIARARDFLKRGNCWAAPVDIDDFFDSIHHETLMEILERDIPDTGVLRLVRLFLSSGALLGDRWEDTFDGVPQGGVLSPVLSNVYLNELDQFLHGRKAAFVRYADDVLILGGGEAEAEGHWEAGRAFLETALRLRLNPAEEPVVHIDRGFAFLGVFFQKQTLRMEFARMDEKMARLRRRLSGAGSLEEAVRRFNEFAEGIRRYYFRIFPENHQLDTLESRMFSALAHFIAEGRAAGRIETRKACRAALAGLAFIRVRDEAGRKLAVEKIVQDAFSRQTEGASDAARDDGPAAVRAAVGQKRRQYARKIASETELVVSSFGHFVGYTRDRFTVKHKGRVVASVPKNRLRRLVVSSPGVSISSDCIHQCCKRNVSIEFLSGRGEPFAMVYSPQFALTAATSAQLALRDGEAGRFLARCFLRGKAKNQINLLKYFNKYLAKAEPEAGAAVAAEIEAMERLCRELDDERPEEEREAARNRLMGVEGAVSRSYWAGVRRILPPEAKFEKRVGQGAGDAVNSSLNYGYGMLYNRVQQALADAGAALHVSFLHEPRGREPTLVYDLIEEFRQFVVDRTVIAMFNRGEPLRTDKRGWLTEAARELVVKNVRERLGSYLNWRGKKWLLEDIVFHQARLLMHHVRGEKRYRPFVGRY